MSEHIFHLVHVQFRHILESSRKLKILIKYFQILLTTQQNPPQAAKKSASKDKKKATPSKKPDFKEEIQALDLKWSETP